MPKCPTTAIFRSGRSSALLVFVSVVAMVAGFSAQSWTGAFPSTSEVPSAWHDAVPVWPSGYALAYSVPPVLNLTAAGSISDSVGSLYLDGSNGIAILESDGRTYAVLTSTTDDGVQILDLTDPYSIYPGDAIGDNDILELDTALGIVTFKSGGRTYAAVASYGDDGVQVLDLTNPYNVTAAGHITDDDTLLMDGAWDVAVFEHDGSTYAALTSRTDSGVQVLQFKSGADHASIPEP